MKMSFKIPEQTSGERAIATELRHFKIKFIPEKDIYGLKGDSKSHRRADFYLKEFDIYLEYLGSWDKSQAHRDRYNEKKRIYSKNGIKCIYLYPSHLKSSGFIIKRELEKFGIIYNPKTKTFRKKTKKKPTKSKPKGDFHPIWNPEPRNPIDTPKRPIREPIRIPFQAKPVERFLFNVAYFALIFIIILIFFKLKGNVYVWSVISIFFVWPIIGWHFLKTKFSFWTLILWGWTMLFMLIRLRSLVFN